MKLTLIRHTALQVASGICYGQSDIDVAASFPQELATLKTALIDTKFEAIYTSPLQRCTRLASGLNMGDTQTDTRLKELDFGDWEMQTWDDIPRDIFDAWALDYANISPPNGETFSQLQQRGLSFLENMRHQHPNGNIFAVTHGGMIRALVAHVLDMPLKKLFRMSIDYGSLTQLEFGSSVPKVNYVNRHHSNI
ncbi:MAG: alpha-ribazole phosphatase [Methylophilaceae bacterium]